MFYNCAKNHSPKLWTVYATNENTVWYCILTKNGLKYKTIDEIDDLSDLFVFETKRSAMESVKGDIYEKFIPAEATDIEVEQGYITRENQKVWFDSIQHKRYTLKEALKWH
jgi:hypothetical protein